MFKKIISLLILFFCIINSYSYGIYSSIPVWNEDIIETNSGTVDNSTKPHFELESESAILIEQTTRKNTI